jgi:hypothetical protein
MKIFRNLFRKYDKDKCIRRIMGKHILHRIKKGESFTLRMEGLEQLFGDFFINDKISQYPDKVVLPLEEFCQFYFKDLKEFKFKERVEIAYDDASSMFWSVMGNPLETSPDPENIDTLHSSYFEKMIISRFAAYKYVRSVKSVEEVFQDEKYWNRLGHRLLRQCVELQDEPVKDKPYYRLNKNLSQYYVSLHPSGTRFCIG